MRHLGSSIGSILTEAQTTWDAAQRTGSRGIFVWESTDLINWKNERLVQVEDKTAGMVWAPEAIWDANKGQYLVHWASKFYAASDTGHTGTPSNIKIRFACMQSPLHMFYAQRLLATVFVQIRRGGVKIL